MNAFGYSTDKRNPGVGQQSLRRAKIGQYFQCARCGDEHRTGSGIHTRDEEGKRITVCRQRRCQQ